jgi:hypothetical protein
MLRSTLPSVAALATLALLACAQTSPPQPMTTAPVVSATATDPSATPTPTPTTTTTPTPTPTTTTTLGSPPVSATTPPAASDGADPQFRACKADSDCAAVPLAGCCDNGRRVAVAVAQKDAYAQANACTRKRPICPMFRVRDQRVSYCDAQAHLCSLRQP